MLLCVCLTFCICVFAWPFVSVCLPDLLLLCVCLTFVAVCLPDLCCCVFAWPLLLCVCLTFCCCVFAWPFVAVCLPDLLLMCALPNLLLMCVLPYICCCVFAWPLLICVCLTFVVVLLDCFNLISNLMHLICISNLRTFFAAVLTHLHCSNTYFTLFVAI